MARTYWEPKADQLGTYEFLGAFRDGHVVKDPKQPQGKGFILDIQDIPDPQGVLDRLADRVLLVGLPSAITKRLQARMPTTLPWAQVEGFLK